MNAVSLASAGGHAGAVSAGGPSRRRSRTEDSAVDRRWRESARGRAGGRGVSWRTDSDHSGTPDGRGSTWMNCRVTAGSAVWRSRRRGGAVGRAASVGAVH